MRNLWVVLALSVSSVAVAQGAQPTPEELLTKMDQNLTFEARRSRMVMTVEGRRRRSFEMVSYGRGEEDTAMEYVAPARDKGTKMLKLGDELWIYLPGADRVQKISGHMMRQGMMGSDVSYEDLMSSRDLATRYTAKVTGGEELDGRKVWRLELKAKDPTVTYPKRVTFVDQETFIPLKQELYALSGMLLKTWTMSDLKPFPGGRVFPMKMTIQDHVKKESVTRIEFKELEFGIQYPTEVFSLRWLERR